MTHVSGAVYTLWSILSVTLFGFLISHLWKFDRFKCLRWGSSGQSSGAFKRVMTFSYLLSVPLLMGFSICLMVIKYREGYADVPGHGIIPKPVELWSHQDRQMMLPIYILFAVAWGLEIVSHLEEMCFWLFLVNVSASHSSWFQSWHFKLWVCGSLLGMIGMPLLAWFTRSNLLQCEAWIFFAGSVGGMLITGGSLRVLWVFPKFLRRVKSAGGEPEVVIRLTTFHDLNVIRVIFRFFFHIPLFTLAVDGIRSEKHHPVNESALWVDFLGSLAGLGMVVSSCLTLLIFFPRSIEREAGYKPRRKSTTGRNDEISLQPISTPQVSPASQPYVYPSPQHEANVQAQQPVYPTRSPTTKLRPLVEDDENPPRLYRDPEHKRTEVWELVNSPTEGPGSRGFTAPAAGSVLSFESRVPLNPALRAQQRAADGLHPMLMNYSSPINFAHENASAFHKLHRPQNPV